MVVQLVRLARFWAGGAAFRVEGQLDAVGGHPARMFGRHAHDQSVVRNVFGDHSARGHKGMRAKGDTTANGGVGPDGGPALDKRGFVCSASVDGIWAKKQ